MLSTADQLILIKSIIDSSFRVCLVGQENRGKDIGGGKFGQNSIKKRKDEEKKMYAGRYLLSFQN